MDLPLHTVVALINHTNGNPKTRFTHEQLLMHERNDNSGLSVDTPRQRDRGPSLGQSFHREATIVDPKYVQVTIEKTWRIN